MSLSNNYSFLFTNYIDPDVVTDGHDHRGEITIGMYCSIDESRVTICNRTTQAMCAQDILGMYDFCGTMCNILHTSCSESTIKLNPYLGVIV